MRKLVRYIILIVNIIFSVLLLFTYLVSWVNPAFFWLPSLLGLIYPFLIIMNIVFIIFWIFFHWQYSLISLMCIVLGLNTFNSFFQLKGRKIDSGEGLKVLSYNVSYFNSYLDKGKNNKSILDFIASQQADLICLQETKLQKQGALNPVKLKSYFPGIRHCQLAHQSEWGGPVTFSKYPIINMGELRFKESANLVIYCDIKTSKDTIRVYNCHLQSYGIDVRKYSVIDTLGFEKKKLKEMLSIGSKLKNGYVQRSVQIKKLKQHISRCRYPVIVCGDFNDTPISYCYGEMTSNLKDSFVGSGRGLSATYNGKLPSYRIDYIFHSDFFKSYNYKKINVNYSDHYPIAAFLEYPD